MMYGCTTIPKCGCMNIIGVVCNYGLIVICWYRYGVTLRLFLLLMLTALFTVFAYHVDTTLIGTSAIWNVWYGYSDRKTVFDHAFFVFSNVSVVVAYNFLPWPWPFSFVWKCIVAHCVAALVGHALRPGRDIRTSKVECARPELTNRFDVFAD